MKKLLRILHLEDNPRDAALVEALLDSNGIICQITCIKSRAEFLSHLEKDEINLIISDFSMPQFDGLSALRLSQERCPHIPFLFLSGTIGEETAVEALKEGATDYVLKDRLSRLPSSIERAVKQAEEQKARQRVEEELRKSEERFQLATRATNDVIWDWNLKTNECCWNDNFRKLFGHEPQLEKGINFWFNLIHPEHRGRVVSSIRAAINGDVQTWSDEYSCFRADGSVAHVLDRGHIIRDFNHQAVRMIGAITDITPRRQSEEKIRAQAALLDKAQDAICLTDMHQKILYWNKGAERLYGWKADEALDKNANDLLFPEEIEAPLEPFRNLIRSGEWQGELNQLTRAGRKIMVESRWTLMRDDLDNPVSILVINTDVTEKKEFQTQLLRNQRLESIGALAGGIAHDLNNALTPVLMAGTFLRDESLSDEAKEILEMMVFSAKRGSEMVKQILSFSRGVGGQHTSINLAGIISEVGKLARDTFPRAITIHTQVADDLNAISGNSTQMHQVLLNLCVNARDAMGENGRLEIKAQNLMLTTDNLPAAGVLRPGPYVLMQVSDTGCGIPEELKDKIFEPFFTTKDINQGTGLGLSTVVGIVKTHGGFIDLDSAVGFGTTFRIYLPAIVSSQPSADPRKPVIKTGHGEHILVVDDEVAILELTKISLETFNYRVSIATNGAEALELFQRQKDDIHVVLTDMMMPVMSGAELVKGLRKLSPSVKVICMSGLSLESVFRQARELQANAVLSKPFATEELLEELHRAIALGKAAGN